jgi:uncharacterized membrane protein
MVRDVYVVGDRRLGRGDLRNGARIGYLWHMITASFWFVPGPALVLAIAWALSLDSRLDVATPSPMGWVYGGGPDGARALLATVAGAMITVARLAFSLTLIALRALSPEITYPDTAITDRRW